MLIRDELIIITVLELGQLHHVDVLILIHKKNCFQVLSCLYQYDLEVNVFSFVDMCSDQSWEFAHLISERIARFLSKMSE